MNKRELISHLEKNDIDPYRIEIMNKLIEGDLNTSIIKSIYNVLSKNHSVIKSFIQLLKKNNNIHSIGTDKIEQILYHHDVETTNNTINFMLNNRIDIKDLICYSIKDIKFFAFSSILNENISNDLYNIKWSGIGRGEILLCMILKNAISNSYKRGDILINDKIIEVKSDNSKLVNQSDFASGDEVSNYWINTIKNHPKIKKEELLRGHNNNLKWNLTRDNNFLNHYVELLITKGVDIKEITEIICCGWDKLFINEKINRSPIRKIIRKYKSLNGEAFGLYTFEIFIHNMNYYINQSNIDHIALTSIDGFYLLDKEFFKQNKDKLRDFSKNNFLYKYPSLTKTASNGRVFSISLLEG